MTLREFLLARLGDQRTCCDGTGEYSGCGVVSEFAEHAVEAMRQVVDIHDGDHYCVQYIDPGDNNPCSTLLALAAVYADHPDFRTEWPPTPDPA